MSARVTVCACASLWLGAHVSALPVSASVACTGRDRVCAGEGEPAAHAQFYFLRAASAFSEPFSRRASRPSSGGQAFARRVASLRPDSPPRRRPGEPRVSAPGSPRASGRGGRRQRPLQTRRAPGASGSPRRPLLTAQPCCGRQRERALPLETRGRSRYAPAGSSRPVPHPPEWQSPWHQRGRRTRVTRALPAPSWARTCPRCPLRRPSARSWPATSSPPHGRRFPGVSQTFNFLPVPL